MDVASIASAYQGLKAAKDILGVVFDSKVDAEAKPKVLDAMQKLGDAQDALFSLREELFSLQEWGMGRWPFDEELHPKLVPPEAC